MLAFGYSMSNLRLKIRYFGLLKNAVGLEEDEIAVCDGVSVADVFQLLTQKHGEQFSLVMLRADGSLRPTAMVVVDGRDIRDSKGLGTKLESNHEIFLAVGIYPVAGG